MESHRDLLAVNYSKDDVVGQSLIKELNLGIRGRAQCGRSRLGPSLIYHLNPFHFLSCFEDGSDPQRRVIPS